MKDNYTYSNKKIIVSDDNLGLLEYDYHDNVDEELATENIIEKIQQSLESSKYALGCQETIKHTKYNKKKIYIRYILNILIPTISIIVLFTLLTSELNLAIFISVPSMILGTSLNILDKEEYNKVQNKINALLIQIDELNDKLIIEKQKLNTLTKDKKISSNSKNDINHFTKINDHKLQQLSDLELLWYQTGYNINLLYKYEKKGILEKILHDEYNQDELKIIQKITQEKGPKLIKRKIHDNK